MVQRTGIPIFDTAFLVWAWGGGAGFPALVPWGHLYQREGLQQVSVGT